MADIDRVKTVIFEMLQRNTWKDIDNERHRFQPVLNDALKLLKDSVPQSVVDQIRWERDTALSQLKEIGKCLGEKMDDVKPMKPHYTTLKYIVSGKEVSVKHPECPKCIKNSGLYLWDAEIERGQAFCKRCGQAIDWSKDGEQE